MWDDKEQWLLIIANSVSLIHLSLTIMTTKLLSYLVIYTYNIPTVIMIALC